MRNLDLFAVFECTRSSDLKRLLCKNEVLLSVDFIKAVNAATLHQMGVIRCRSLCRLLKTDWDIGLVVSDVARGDAKARKIAKLASQLERANRTHIHMFYRDEGPEWWAFQFSLHDLGATERAQHWDRPHIHLTTWLSHPLRTKEWLIGIMQDTENPNFPHDHHVPFEGT